MLLAAEVIHLCRHTCRHTWAAAGQHPPVPTNGCVEGRCHAHRHARRHKVPLILWVAEALEHVEVEAASSQELGLRLARVNHSSSYALHDIASCIV